MMYLLEWVTEQTVLMRHPNMGAAVRAFFRDAGSKSVRAFYDEGSGLGGYVFHVVNPKQKPDEDDTGRYYRLVTTCDVTWTVQPGSGEKQMIRPTAGERGRIENQFNKHEWISGTFRGRLDRVANVNVLDSPEEGAEE